jgi:D-beta-D-heptose 7-phosphate kinase/D-beta-D-heptose 1-phosphate adenosyltransferase
MNTYAPIINLEDFQGLKPALIGTIVCTSGGFDPIHPGHISCFVESKNFGDHLVVIVNGDSFLKIKRGKVFQNLDTRCRIVSAIRGVDYVIPFEIENDQSVCVALEQIKPHVFTKGGDRKDPSSIPEWEVCQRLGIDVVFGVGEDKQWSSSDYLAKWTEDIERERDLLFESMTVYKQLLLGKPEE